MTVTIMVTTTIVTVGGSRLPCEHTVTLKPQSKHHCDSQWFIVTSRLVMGWNTRTTKALFRQLKGRSCPKHVYGIYPLLSHKQVILRWTDTLGGKNTPLLPIVLDGTNEKGFYI